MRGDRTSAGRPSDLPMSNRLQEIELNDVAGIWTIGGRVSPGLIAAPRTPILRTLSRAIPLSNSSSVGLGKSLRWIDRAELGPPNYDY
jgi:hypothetical protein